MVDGLVISGDSDGDRCALCRLGHGEAPGREPRVRCWSETAICRAGRGNKVPKTAVQG